MKSYIHKLILEGEHQQLDFKFQITDSRKIARSLVAFANSQGGRLLIGVKDNGAVAGMRTEEEYHMIEAASKLYCRPEVPFKSKLWNVDGKQVLEVIVDPQEDKPFMAQDEEEKWWAYIRVKDLNILANSVLIKYWNRRKNNQGTLIKYSDKETLLLNYLQNHQRISVTAFCKIANINRYKAETILVNLLCARVIKIIPTEKQFHYALRGEK